MPLRAFKRKVMTKTCPICSKPIEGAGVKIQREDGVWLYCEPCGSDLLRWRRLEKWPDPRPREINSSALIAQPIVHERKK